MFTVLLQYEICSIIQGPAEIPDDLATELWVELLAWGICPWAPF